MPVIGAALTALIYRTGEPKMQWWILELVVASILIAIALSSGRSSNDSAGAAAADVFRSNPSTGKSFIVLTDFAYYLIFLGLHSVHDHRGPTPRMVADSWARADPTWHRSYTLAASC
ncbi:MAG: hypothetical protein R2706_20955 [Acidimicrobiales bacterium]